MFDFQEGSRYGGIASQKLGELASLLKNPYITKREQGVRTQPLSFELGKICFAFQLHRHTLGSCQHVSFQIRKMMNLLLL